MPSESNKQLVELVVSISIGVISALCLSGILIIVLICKKRKPNSSKKLENIKSFHEMNVQSQENSEMAIVADKDCVDPSNQTLDDEQWMDDISKLVPFCLAILKNCRSLTEQLTALTMGALNSSGDGLSQIVLTARCISTKVDDLVLSMYPPLDPRLLEARASALILAVTQLAMVARYECQSKNIPMGWIDRALNELQSFLKILRDVAYSEDLHNISSITTISSEATDNIHTYTSNGTLRTVTN